MGDQKGMIYDNQGMPMMQQMDGLNQQYYDSQASQQ